MAHREGGTASIVCRLQPSVATLSSFSQLGVNEVLTSTNRHVVFVTWLKRAFVFIILEKNIQTQLCSGFLFP